MGGRCSYVRLGVDVRGMRSAEGEPSVPAGYGRSGEMGAAKAMGSGAQGARKRGLQVSHAGLHGVSGGGSVSTRDKNRAAWDG